MVIPAIGGERGRIRRYALFLFYPFSAGFCSVGRKGFGRCMQAARLLHAGCTVAARRLHCRCTQVALLLHAGCSVTARGLQCYCTRLCSVTAHSFAASLHTALQRRCILVCSKTAKRMQYVVRGLLAVISLLSDCRTPGRKSRNSPSAGCLHRAVVLGQSAFAGFLVE